jgi:ABC-type lipoprotein release transport system permease subunit
MRYEIDLARSFMKSTRGKKHYHPHIWLSILGIAVGVGFLIFALSIYDGYVKKIETIIFSFYPQITLQSEIPPDERHFEIDDDFLLEEKKDVNCDKVCGGKVILEDKTLSNQENPILQEFSMKKYEDLRPKLQAIEGVKRISPIIFEEADFIYSCTDGQKTDAAEGPLRILGIQPGQEIFVPEIQRTITDRSLLQALEKPGTHQVIVSEELSRKLFPGPRAGSFELAANNKKITLALKSENLQPGRRMELNVAGTFKLGMHKISENMIITSLETARQIFAMGQQATFVGVTLDDPYQAPRIADKIKESTVDDHLLIYHWMAVAADMFNSLSFYRKIVIVVLLMSILITSFNIYTTLNIMILERKKQIGILMSMGIKKASLYRTFVIISQIEAAVGTAIGILTGVILGYSFSDYLNRSLEAFVHIQEAGTVLHVGTALFIFGFVCLLCGLTALWATRKGANLDPVEALRSE